MLLCRLNAPICRSVNVVTTPTSTHFRVRRASPRCHVPARPRRAAAERGSLTADAAAAGGSPPAPCRPLPPRPRVPRLPGRQSVARSLQDRQSGRRRRRCFCLPVSAIVCVLFLD